MPPPTIVSDEVFVQPVEIYVQHVEILYTSAPGAAKSEQEDGLGEPLHTLLVQCHGMVKEEVATFPPDPPIVRKRDGKLLCALLAHQRGGRGKEEERSLPSWREKGKE